MNSNQKPDTKPENPTAPETKPALKHDPIVSERAVRTNWMPFWRPVDEGIDPSTPFPFF